MDTTFRLWENCNYNNIIELIEWFLERLAEDQCQNQLYATRIISNCTTTHESLYKPISELKASGL